MSTYCTKVSLQAFGTTLRTLKSISTYFDKVRRNVLFSRRITFFRTSSFLYLHLLRAVIMFIDAPKSTYRNKKCLSTWLFDVILRFFWMSVYVNSIHIYEIISTSFFEFFYVLFVVYLRAFRHFYDVVRSTNLDPRNHSSDEWGVTIGVIHRNWNLFLQVVGKFLGSYRVCVEKHISEICLNIGLWVEIQKL